MQSLLEVRRNSFLAMESAQDGSKHTATVHILTAAVRVGQERGLDVIAILGSKMDQRRVRRPQVSGNYWIR